MIYKLLLGTYVALFMTVVVVVFPVGGPRAQVPRPAAAAVVPVAAERSADETYPGVLLAPSSVEMAPSIEGRLVAVHVAAGDVVEKDAIVATFDDRSIRDDIAIAKAGHGAAAAEAQQARVELTAARDRAMRRDGAVTVGDMTVPIVSAEEAQQAKLLAKAAASRASAAGAGAAERWARIRRLETLLAETQLRAPFRGVVAARYADTGAYVRAGAPVIRLIASADLKLRFAVPEENARAVPRRVQVLLDDRTFFAEVTAVAPEVEPASRRVFVDGALLGIRTNESAALAGRVVRVRAP